MPLVGVNHRQHILPTSKILVHCHSTDEHPVQRKTQIIITCYWGWLGCEQIMSEATTTKKGDQTKKTKKKRML